MTGAREAHATETMRSTMDPSPNETKPLLTTYEGLAKMIDHSMVRPELTDEEVVAGCELAKRYQVASVCVRPCDVDLAVRLLGGSGVAVGSLAGFPHGSSTTAVKLYEIRDVLRRGAKEVDMVINISKLLSRQFQYVEMELLQAAEECHKQGALLKVIFENAYLTDELKIVACRIAARTQVDFVKTSTAFAATGCTLPDLKLMRAHTPEHIGVKAAGGVRTLDQALEAYQAGCSRIGATATSAILDEWKARLESAASTAAS
jgi:deoxyribose-phosphate aldolase